MRQGRLRVTLLARSLCVCVHVLLGLGLCLGHAAADATGAVHASGSSAVDASGTSAVYEHGKDSDTSAGTPTMPLVTICPFALVQRSVATLLYTFSLLIGVACIGPR